MRKYFISVVAIASSAIISCQQSQPSNTQVQQTTNAADVKVPLKVSLLNRGTWTKAIGESCIIADLSKLGKSDMDITPRILKELKITVKNAKGEIVGIGNLQDPKIVKDGCAFKSSVNVSESPAYSVSIGKVEATFSLEEIKKGEVSLPISDEELNGMIK